MKAVAPLELKNKIPIVNVKNLQFTFSRKKKTAFKNTASHNSLHGTVLSSAIPSQGTVLSMPSLVRGMKIGALKIVLFRGLFAFLILTLSAGGFFPQQFTGSWEGERGSGGMVGKRKDR